MIKNEEVLKDLTVVLVEDDELIAELVARSLRRKVKTVHVGKNGLEGWELTAKYNPDIIITDIEMPVMNGLDMIQKIRENFDGLHPIIVVTAYADDEHKTDLANAYLFKPVDKNQLFEEIIQLVMKKY